MSPPDGGSCAEVSALLAERASGPLQGPEATAVERHLLGCAACRASAAEWEALFSLVALPPATLKEEAALRGLPERTLAAWRRREGQKRGVRGLLAAAALLSAAALPLWLRQPAPSPGAQLATASAVQLEASEGLSWDLEEPEATESVSTEGTSDDTTLLDGLALEGDGAFALGDSG